MARASRLPSFWPSGLRSFSVMQLRTTNICQVTHKTLVLDKKDKPVISSMARSCMITRKYFSYQTWLLIKYLLQNLKKIDLGAAYHEETWSDKVGWRSCEHGNVVSGFIKGGEFLDQMSDY
jgi:hypothetical protein